jgi:hypothetical protein
MAKKNKEINTDRSERTSKIRLNAGDTYHQIDSDTFIIFRKSGKGKGKDSAPDFPKKIQICKCSASELTCTKKGDTLQCVEECTEWDCKTYEVQ